VWDATVDGRVLHFHLAGINNQNFIMRDEETGSWWQQVTGEAILGPLKGHRLKNVFHDELSFGLWKQEQPQGRVLRPDERILAANEYETSDWEQRMARAPVVTGTDKDHRLQPRTLVIGITLGSKSMAYPHSALVKQSPIMDFIGAVPVVIVLGPDNRSVRAYERTVGGRRLEFFKTGEGASAIEQPKTTAAGQFQLLDGETGSVWNFEGKAISGPLSGSQLKKLPVLEDYWFDWRIYHPETFVYEIGPG
jgi:hypothetical protein